MFFHFAEISNIRALDPNIFSPGSLKIINIAQVDSGRVSKNVLPSRLWLWIRGKHPPEFGLCQ